MSQKPAILSHFNYELSQDKKLQHNIANLHRFSREFYNLFLYSFHSQNNNLCPFIEQWLKPAAHPWYVLGLSVELFAASIKKYCDNDELFTILPRVYGFFVTLAKQLCEYGADLTLQNQTLKTKECRSCAQYYAQHSSCFACESSKVRELFASSYKTASAQDFIFVINEKQELEYLGQYAANVLGEQQHNVLGVPWKKFVDTNSYELHKKEVDDIFIREEPVRDQACIELRDGNRLFLDSCFVPLYGSEKKRVLLGICKNLKQQLPKQEIRDGSVYHSLFDTMPDALFILQNNVILDCNRSSEELFGLSRFQMIGKPFVDLFGGYSTIEQTEELIQKMKTSAHGPSRKMEYRYQQKKNVHFFEILFKQFLEAGSDKLLAVVSDITEVRKTNDALRSSEARFRDIIRCSIDGYYFINADGEMSHLNRSGQQVLTYSKEEMNQLFLARLDEPRNARLRRLIERAMSGKNVVWEEIRFIDKHGLPRWIAYNARPVWEDERLLGIEGFIKDITLRKNTENELIESEARYRALLQNIPFAVFGISSDYYFIKTNYHFEQQFGNLENKKVETLEPTHLSRLILSLCKRAKRQKSALQQNIKINQDKILQAIVAPIAVEASAVIGFAGMLIDISENVIALEEKNTFAEKLIQTSEEEQRRISREIHDSLGQLLFALQLEITAAKSALPNNIKRATSMLQNSENLLSQSLKEAGDLCYRLHPRLLDDFGFVEALNELVEQLGKRHLHVAISVGEYGVQKQSIETALYRICQEALSNILKHASATKVEITLRENTKKITLLILDNGKGFDVNKEMHQKRRGFGLINMKERIELLDGEYILKSAPGEGTQIQVTIPKK